MVHPAPRHVGDMEQAVDAAEIDESAILGDIFDHAVDRLALGELRDDLGALLGARFFQDRAARHDDVAAAAVHLQDLERLVHVHERTGVSHGTHVDLAARQERHGAAEIDGEAAFDAAEDLALDALLLLGRLLQTVPSLLAAGLLAAQDGFAPRVLDPVEIHFHHVAHVDFGGLAGKREFLDVDPAFHLVADVDDGLSRLDGEDRAFDDATLVGGLELEALVQQRFEVFHGCRSWHSVLLINRFPAGRLVPPVFR